MARDGARARLTRLRGAQQASLNVEHGGREAVAVGQQFAQQGKRRGTQRRDLADDAGEIEAQLGVELARKLLHALVVGKARHVQELDAAVAGGEQRSLEQRRADAVALPGPLDRECRFASRASGAPIGRNSAVPRNVPPTKNP